MCKTVHLMYNTVSFYVHHTFYDQHYILCKTLYFMYNTAHFMYKIVLQVQNCTTCTNYPMCTTPTEYEIVGGWC